MNEPRGPLSPSVYRRRRFAAMTGLGVGALLFIWAVGALLGGNDSQTVRGAADLRPAGVPLTSDAPSDPPATGRLAAPVRSGVASASATSPRSTTSIGPMATTTPTSTSSGATTPPTTTTSTPPALKPCPDSAVRVTVTSDQSHYPVGAHPVLTLHIANAGPVACTRDVSHQLRSIEILAAGGTTVIWASDDCYSLTTHEIPTLQPKQTLSYSVTWAGRTAAPGCPVSRTTVPAGTYELVGKLGDLTGPPTPFTLTS